ncbi:ABC transporter ATP-binding protein [Pseudomonas sp. ZM23]|uniref:ABC transporter ATP-binding protein n=1 Tax=Pseudomonas triclosanedens TaxID=2961893 RepID=A0ABY7A564_9PSED|nr:ABC transporter ATP-binding protein [Pseudomonas triclosanedens]MCP8464772.1 ABC transporter ATP-binding protein [Pseudomonas triclosanedens]MCP8470515.1 ABC transporter ATP-binding protein [Pseudomonas triclosanedens]MCP8476321.1 ABC transporter ATP-binding protein [Pseudomonas triclosanedens]WAI51450.1 ABC transporter ATP-binding protein [Pseudomonas triclosanedens]
MLDSSGVAVRAVRVGKCFQVFDSPGRRFLYSLFAGKINLQREFWAVRDVSFDIYRGEVVGVIGRNGSGKSTLLQMIAGTLSPNFGWVGRSGRVAALLELGAGFDVEETGRRNIEFTAKLLGLSSSDVKSRVESIIDFSGIEDFIDRPVKTYSSGMIVRLAFAVAAHVDADIVVVDEALAVGDAEFQFKCLSRLDQLLSRGVTVILVSHDLQLVKSYCQRVLYLRSGRLVFDGDCESGCEEYQRDSASKLFFSSVGAPSGTARESQDLSGEAGQIISAVLAGDGGGRGFFVSGEYVHVDVVAQISKSVLRPRVTLVVRDIRGYNLYAINNSQLGCDLVVGCNGFFQVRFGFIADLQDGTYAVTVRLDDAVSEGAFCSIDKKVGALTFRVESPQKKFDAVVNLHGTIEVLSFS